MSDIRVAVRKPAAGPDGGDRYSWRYIFEGALDHRRNLLTAHLVALLAVLAAIPIPLLLPLLVDEVLLGHPGALVAAMNNLAPAGWHGPLFYIVAVSLATMALRLAGLVLGVWQSRLFTGIAKDVTYRIRRALLERLQRISMAEYETLGTGAVASRLVTDVNVIDDFIGVSVSKTLIAALSLVGVSVVLLWMNWQLALFILLVNPLVVYLTVALGKRVKELKRRENSAFELFQQALAETLDAIQQIRASNRERHYLGAVLDRARGIKSHAAAFSWQSDAANRLSFVVFLLGFDAFRAASMLMVAFSDLSIGQMMAVYGYLWFMMSPVQELLHIQYAYYSANAALGRINALVGLREEPRYPHRHDPFVDRTTVGLSLRGVSFAYGEGPPVLKNLSLEIAPGEKVALVGASGGGKSTLVQIILGLYPPTEGGVYFDDVPVTEIGLDVVREHVAVVLQQPALFNDSIRANLTLGREADDAELWQALGIAQLREVVAVLPEGLDTVIGRRGLRLSGGQQQRLAIARMVLTRPQVVILDEATSALDVETEARVHAALGEFLRERTTLIITHRLSAVRQAERIYVFENGQVSEQGPHEALIRGGGLYQRLYGARSGPA